MEPSACPLCRSAAKMKKAKELYGYRVCKKCAYQFVSRRQGAWILDVVFIRILFILAIAMLVVDDETDTEEQAAALPGILLLAELAAITLKDGFSGQSLGKAICGVRVVDERSGEPGGFLHSFKRNLPLLIPFAPLLVAAVMVRGPRLGDRWAGTRVVWKKYERHPVFSPGARVGEVFD